MAMLNLIKKAIKSIMKKEENENITQEGPTLPTWIGTCKVHYYTKQEVREIIEGLDASSYNFRPYYYSRETIGVTRFEKGHPYYDNQFFCAVVSSGGCYPGTELWVNADTGLEKMVAHVWDLLKKIYVEIGIDIENMTLIDAKVANMGDLELVD